MPSHDLWVGKLLDNALLVRLLERAPDWVRRDLDALVSLLQTESAETHDGAIQGETIAKRDVCAEELESGRVIAVNVFRGVVRDGGLYLANIVVGDISGGRVRGANLVVGALRSGSVELVNVLIGEVTGGLVENVNILVGDVRGGTITGVNVLVGDVHGGSVRAHLHLGRVHGGVAEVDVSRPLT